MGPSGYERLSALEHSFLLAEKPSVHMHVAAIQIFDTGGLRNGDGGIDVEAFKRRVQTLLHLVPRCRQKLEWTPLENHPVWVDDHRFDLDHHVQLTSLPRPGTDEQLKVLAAEILEKQLDRARPLWEIWVVEGLSRGRFAVVSKFHHCMIDGAGGVDLVGILLSRTPDPEGLEPEAYLPRPMPTPWELLRGSWQRRVALPFKVMRDLRDFVLHATNLRDDLAARVGALGQVAGWALRPASVSPLNGKLSAHRRFDWLSLPLEEVRAVRRAAGCSLNDVVLAVVAGAIRRFLIHRGEAPDREFRVSAPVNIRRQEDRADPGNHVSAWILPLPLGEPDPRMRLAAIRESTRALKESRSALGVEMMMDAAEWAPPILLSLGVRLASGPMNMIVTNVPGPPYPLYMLGARLEAIYPLVPLLEQSGLGIALFSYDGGLCWGFSGSYELVPDLRAFVEMVDESFSELADAFGIPLSTPERPWLGVPPEERSLPMHLDIAIEAV
jgi:diacylglycerol O-acyltransferase / wax synthase